MAPGYFPLMELNCFIKGVSIDSTVLLKTFIFVVYFKIKQYIDKKIIELFTPLAAVSMKKLSLQELNRISIESFKEVHKNPIVVVLDNIRSMHNVGTFFRTGDAFAIEKLILVGITAQPPHREIQKTALGATESVSWEYMPNATNTLQAYKEAGYKIYAIEQTNQSILLQNFNVQTSDRLVVIFGNEVSGVSDELLPLCDGAIEIPQFGTKHSFNVSVTSGIVLWELIRQRKLNN
jgi:23S rRNA (guanosine2251-2'-O)-methyltransferase